jgi:hypothetical protein
LAQCLDTGLLVHAEHYGIVGTGRVIAHVRKRRTSKDFLAFLDSVVKEYPNQRLAIVLDNLNTHTNEAARQWLKTHQLVSFHYTPTHASWVNLIECFFSILTRQGLQQAVHQSGQELEHFLKRFSSSVTRSGKRREKASFL